MKLLRNFLFFSPLFYALTCSAAGNTDVSGSKDHPLLSRYPDTHIIEYRFSEYDELEVRTAKSFNDHGFKHPSKKLEGKLTTIEYQSNTNAPFTQVLRNFGEGLKKAGFKELFSCDGQDTCGPLFVTHAMLETPIHSNFRDYPTSTDSTNGSRYGYWSGSLTRSTGDVAVTVLIGEDGKYREKVDIIVDIVESKPMENNLVVVNPQFLSDSIVRDGKAVLNGILFDTDKATIKTESSAALKAIADYMEQNKTSKVFIVGHTDTTGDFQHNTGLSQQRAQAVVDTLSSTYKIDKSRLRAAGVGPVSPAASNSTEEGKAKNRRVEMVLD
ncbi:MAG: OmpA/MotB [Verrucomicrobiaceae bacterium]|nr:OmpA/MotB [Verrucomicrobiaceae bacterium]